MTTAEDYDTQDEEDCREASLKLLRRAEAQLTAKGACGVIVIMLDAEGFAGSFRSMPNTRAVVSEAICVLDEVSARLHQHWCDSAMDEGDPDAAPLQPVDTPKPEDT